MPNARAFAAIVSLVPFVACSSSGEGASTANVETFESAAVTIAPAEEKYMCFAKTLDHDVAIDRFDFAKTDGIHHAILARTTAPEPDGLSECKVLFRTSWIPIFLSATGDATLQMPEGSGVVLTKGTQVVVQLHLLNAGSAPVTTRYLSKWRKSPLANPDPVGVYAFGSTSLSIPPKSVSSQSDECTVEDDLDIFAAGPHMHYLGRTLRFETGPSTDALKEVYRVDGFNFDNQIIEPKTLKIAPGTKTRVTCEYDNPHPHEVKFGESSLDEMCFFVAFAKKREGLTACSSRSGGGSSTGNPDCGTKPENALGVGRKCTKGGGECGKDMMCTLDQSASPEGAPGFCFKLGCNATGECGGGDAVCCAPKQAGGAIKTCMPATCRPSDCALAN